MKVSDYIIQEYARKRCYPLKKLSSKRIEEVISQIESRAGCEIPEKSKESIKRELAASYQLNGQISETYINNLVKAYAVAGVE